MRPGYHIEIVTPKKVLLNGMWFGPKKPRNVVIWVHGLGSSMFSKVNIFDKLVDKNTAVLTFYNRGHDKVASVVRTSGERIQAGAAHEIFTDCVDDVEGAVRFARSLGAKRIFLAGHSTGCQKSIYWVAKKGKGVAGIVLLAPVSDWAAEMQLQGKGKIERAAKMARSLVKRGKKQQLLPETIWHETLDAQRFLSLYTRDSIEQSIFSYFDPKRPAKILSSAKQPILALLAERDEFAARPVKDIIAWFEKSMKNKHKIVVVPKTGHSFRGAEKQVANEIAKFMKEA